ncbi:hypothetical protein OOZ63_27545 [Paucibacter sp. PLA-PC-4]|uniref:hypothetical protein n=1 Tax=Paucibacter sp. PLA-PC-4 TaxID=2993655 RepID=UPI00224B23FF|nr:hypothetical protein [Paucibacter sp. PLA-PC-4]MCX2865582.1 hypothetical protein [Paucibacter sp. PLA-PC-4]
MPEKSNIGALDFESVAALMPAFADPGYAHSIAPLLAGLGRALSMVAEDSRDARLSEPLRKLVGRALWQACESDRAYELALGTDQLIGRLDERRRSVLAAWLCGAVCIDMGDHAGALKHLHCGLNLAREAEDAAMEVMLLINLTHLFECVEDVDAAASCAAAAHARANSTPGWPPSALCAAVLAAARVARAEALDRQGFREEALVERRRAVADLPAHECRDDWFELDASLYALARLERVDDARALVPRYVSACRRLRPGDLRRAHYLMTISAWYVAVGDSDRAIRSMQRSLRRMDSLGRRHAWLVGARRLANLQAATGRHQEAVVLLRRARSMREQVESGQVSVQSRLNMLERQVEARVVERRSEFQHTERLALIGRLMSQIYHSLEAPVRGVCSSLQRCVDDFASMSTDELARALAGVIANVDEATRLARQLKMFSYRSAPQQMAVNLAQALQDAWSGIGFPASADHAPVVPRGDAFAEVSCDIQRLAVLLRILLLEIERIGGGSAPCVRVRVRGNRAGISLDISRGLGAAVSPGVGLTLCEEIAREMQGSLQVTEIVPGRLRFGLELPARS